jgi:hypothetical protein
VIPLHDRRVVHVQADRLEPQLLGAGGDVFPQVVPVGRPLEADLHLVHAALFIAVADGEKDGRQPLLQKQEFGVAEQPGHDQQADDHGERKQSIQLGVEELAEQPANAGDQAEPADHEQY